jgi:putative ubiquitin-RnfH superfamily antitoxin RatB of RatAB toxin-antitoxin module
VPDTGWCNQLLALPFEKSKGIQIGYTTKKIKNVFQNKFQVFVLALVLVYAVPMNSMAKAVGLKVIMSLVNMIRCPLTVWVSFKSEKASRELSRQERQEIVRQAAIKKREQRRRMREIPSISQTCA